MPAGFNKLAIFEIDTPDMELFETFRDRLKEQIQSSPEWRGNESNQKDTSAKSAFDDLDEDIPF
jgi:hypothetical protein